jgi:hypothetical protein
LQWVIRQCSSYFAVQATASSQQGPSGPDYAIDGLVTQGPLKLFHSLGTEVQPWFQLEFKEAMVVKGVTITMRSDKFGEKFRNVAIHVGDKPAVIGALVANPKCAIFQVVHSIFFGPFLSSCFFTPNDRAQNHTQENPLLVLFLMAQKCLWNLDAKVGRSGDKWRLKSSVLKPKPKNMYPELDFS